MTSALIATITREFHFEMGHTLQDHPGKCKRLHGHSYRLEVSAESLLDDRGMVMDFADLKSVVGRCIGELDHMFMICDQDPRALALYQLDPDSIVLVPYPPTAENICHRLRSEIRELLPKQNVHVKLWETHDSRAEA
jgi:6-pyruvoyltetrahydropterin/6-carboxytetrahydropterin synthase